jgi:DNA-binding transcriptional regulator YiaG
MDLREQLMDSNFGKIEQVLKNDYLKIDLTKIDLNDLGVAVYESLEGIQNDLDLTQTEFANILHVPLSTLNDWKKAGRVKISSSLSADDMKLLHFIDLYNAVTSLFKKKADYQAWYRRPLTTKEDSPIEAMKKHVMSIIDLNRYVNWLINP